MNAAYEEGKRRFHELGATHRKMRWMSICPYVALGDSEKSQAFSKGFYEAEVEYLNKGLRLEEFQAEFDELCAKYGIIRNSGSAACHACGYSGGTIIDDKGHCWEVAF